MKSALVALAIIAAAIAQCDCGLGGDRLTFRVKAADFRRHSNSFVKNKQPDDLVEIVLPGKLLNPAHAVILISRGQADWSTTEKAAASAVSANTAGDISWIVECFVPAEREAVAKRLSGPAAAQSARDYFRNLGKVSITGWTELRGITVLFLQGRDDDGDATIITIALSKTPAGWKQTDALASDDTFDVVWTALHTGGVR
jgi:hypothetical protein